MNELRTLSRFAKQKGFKPPVPLFWGYPVKRVEDMNATFKFARKLDPDWCRFNVFVAVPGSTLYEEVIRDHLYDRLEDFVAYVKTESFQL